eukprot:ctg_2061.g590
MSRARDGTRHTHPEGELTRAHRNVHNVCGAVDPGAGDLRFLRGERDCVGAAHALPVGVGEDAAPAPVPQQRYPPARRLAGAIFDVCGEDAQHAHGTSQLLARLEQRVARGVGFCADARQVVPPHAHSARAGGEQPQRSGARHQQTRRLSCGGPRAGLAHARLSARLLGRFPARAPGDPTSRQTCRRRPRCHAHAAAAIDVRRHRPATGHRTARRRGRGRPAPAPPPTAPHTRPPQTARILDAAHGGRGDARHRAAIRPHAHQAVPERYRKARPRACRPKVRRADRGRPAHRCPGGSAATPPRHLRG